MRRGRKLSRDRLRDMRTIAEVERAIDELNVRESDKSIAKMVLINGWSNARIAAETGYSTRAVEKKIAKVYDKLS